MNNLILATALYTKDPGVHMCAYLKSPKSENSTECINDTSKCRKTACLNTKQGCVTVFSNKTGKLTAAYMGCHDVEDITGCGRTSCELEFNNDHYSCCCTESMCNLNTTIKDHVLTTTPVSSGKCYY